MTERRESEHDRRPTNADPVPAAYVPGRTVVFTHVPRTGGSTVKHLLRVVFGTERSCIDVHRYRLPPEALRSLAFVEGHVRVGRQVKVFGDEWTTNGFAMLREPVSRVVSQARHIRGRRLNNPMREHLRGRVASPSDVFDAVPQLNDLQCRMLAGPRNHGDTAGPAGQLERAKETLDQVAFGLTDAFDASMALLAEHFGFWLPSFTQTNASPRLGDRDIRTDEFREEARKRNQFDAELYDYARELFSRRVARYVETLDGLDLDEAPLECALESNRFEVTDGLVRRDGRVRLAGWVLVGGHAADAVLVRVGGRTLPVACGIHERRLGLVNRVWDNLYGGVRGTFEIPAGETSVELVAFDRRRGRRASRTFAVDHRLGRALLHEAARQAKRVPNRLLR